MDHSRSPVLLQYSSPVHISLPADIPTSTPRPSDPTIRDPWQDTNEVPAEVEAAYTEHRSDPPTSLENISSHTTSTAIPVEAVLTSSNPSNAEAQPPDISPDPTSESDPPAIMDPVAASNPTEPTTSSESDVEPPPPPPPPVTQDSTPEWVNFEEDLSSPSAEELLEIVDTDADISALDSKHHEKHFFQNVDDPDQRPIKKIRLSWKIKSVRGTKEKPNMARVMNSPPAFIDGFYWHIKFYPRGNNATTLSAYIKCSKTPPKADQAPCEGSLHVYQGPPDVDLTGIPASYGIEIPSKDTSKPEELTDSSQEPSDASQDSEESAEPVNRVDPNDRSFIANEFRKDDWRLSTQLGMLVYNPAEPRTGYYMASEHQFNKHNDDWGWTNIGGDWNLIHIRKPRQRQALLRNDEIALDAYIRVFDDPTQALWWHAAPETESQWDSKSLAGYFPMGTPPLYHSSGVAGLTSWLLVAPFRSLIESIDGGEWRKDISIKPRPLICLLQQVLFLMRQLKREEKYVNVMNVLEHLANCGETFVDVPSFWEVLRRSIELELAGNEEALTKIRSIFDPSSSQPSHQGISICEKSVSGSPRGLSVAAWDVDDIQSGLDKRLNDSGEKQCFPDFLPIAVARDRFSESHREWRFAYNRVKLNEELDLDKYAVENTSARYTLYGFLVHVGDRASGKFYSVLRPRGPGSKWLAFEDGDGNKIFSYTKRRIEDYEGLDGDNLAFFSNTLPVATMAMYIRTSKMSEYLPGALEAYNLPSWLEPTLPCKWHALDKSQEPKSTKAETVSIQIYNDESVNGRTGLLDMYNLKDVENPAIHICRLEVPPSTTFQEIRRKYCADHGIEKPRSVRLWSLQYTGVGGYISASLVRVALRNPLEQAAEDSRPLCLWVSILQRSKDINSFGYPDPAPVPPLHVPENTVAISTQEVVSAPDMPQDAVIAVIGEPIVAPAVIPTLEVDQSHGETTQSASDLPRVIDDGSAALAVQNVPLTEESAVDEAQDSVIAPLFDLFEMSAVDEAPGSVDMPLTEVSAVDEAQDSVAQAVQAIVNDSTEPQSASSDPQVSDELNPPIHGHLVEAVQGMDEPTTSSLPLVPEQTLSMSLVTVDSEEINAGDSSPRLSSEIISPPSTTVPGLSNESLLTQALNLAGEPTLSTSAINTSEETRDRQPIPVESVLRTSARSEPVRHVYGFLQMFDVDLQNFTVSSSFFAEYKSDVRTFVQKRMGFASDTEFSVWHRTQAFQAVLVPANLTFKQIDFRDGVDLIVGRPIPDAKVESLLKEGKFTTPSSLSYHLWMKARDHPVHGFTGDAILSDFGGLHYTGPLVKGRFHGTKGTLIAVNGCQYTGPFVAGKQSGPEGTMVYQNGDVYTGSWLDDEKDGEGTLTEERTGNVYKGQFSKGKRWGTGVTHWKVADEQADLCQICYGEAVDALFYDCGHVCACVDCAKQCESCPICRRAIQKVVRMYRV